MAILNYDNQGFIIGLNAINRKADKIHDDTQEIIKILKSQRQITDSRLREIAGNLQKINRTTHKLSNKQLSVNVQLDTPSSTRNQTKVANSRNQAPSQNTNQVSRTDAQRARIASQTNHVRQLQDNNRIANRTISDTSHHPINERNPITTRIAPQVSRSSNIDQQQGRNRDAKGRFTKQAEDASFIQKFSEAMGRQMAGVTANDRQLDPLIESMHEAYDLFRPVGRVMGLMGKAGLWSAQKIYRMKRNEPLPRQQQSHNKEVEEQLENIARNSRANRQNGGFFSNLLSGGLGRILGIGAGGMLAGLLSKGKGLLKGGRLGWLGALFGAGSLALNWNNLDHEGKSAGVGELAGGLGGAFAGGAIGTAIFPGVGTAVGAVLGGWLGSRGGEALGKTASPYIQSWVNSLKSYNLADKMKEVWKIGLNPLFSGLLFLPKLLEQGLSFLGLGGGSSNGEGGLLSNAWNGVKSFFGATDSAEVQSHNIKPGKFSGFGHEVDSYIKEASARYGVDEKMMRGLVKMEDGWHGKMSPTGALGVGQFTQGTWNDLVKTSEGQAIGMTYINKSNFRKSNDPRRNKRINTLATALLAKKNADILKKSGIAVNGENLYMAHNMGAGFVQAIYGKGEFAKNTAKNIQVNGGGNMSPQKFIAYQKKRFLQHYADANNVNIEKNSTPSVNQASQPQTAKPQKAKNINANTIVVGDSIAQGYANTRGLDSQYTKVGASPKQILTNVQALVNKGGLSGKTVILSTGMSNDPNDRQNILQQAKLLHQSGAKVKILGVANKFKGSEKNGKLLNDSLKQLADIHGFEFSGGFEAGKDNVHPANYAKLPNFTTANFKQTPQIRPATSSMMAQTQPVMPQPPIINLPVPPKIQQRIDNQDKSMVLTATNQTTIPQNVSDRGLAHAITGGLGEDRFWG